MVINTANAAQKALRKIVLPETFLLSRRKTYAAILFTYLRPHGEERGIAARLEP
jgi:hypothetical protein